jgi:hypothetical protein
LAKGVTQLIESRDDGTDTIQTATMREVSHAVAELSKFNTTLEGIKSVVSEGVAAGAAAGGSSQQKIEVVNKVPNIFLDIIRNQFRVMQTWMGPILQLAEAFPDAEGLKKAAEATEKNYKRLIQQIGESEEQAP